MEADFGNLLEHVIPFSDFSLKWRFTEQEYNVLPDIHLNQLKPLDKDAAFFLSKYISKSCLHNDIPFKKNFFRQVEQIMISQGNESEVRKWLYQRGLPFKRQVYLSWNENTAMIAPWKLVVKYYDDFQYADDLTIFDEGLNWALLFFHEGEVYFGSNEKRFDNPDKSVI